MSAALIPGYVKSSAAAPATAASAPSSNPTTGWWDSLKRKITDPSNLTKFYQLYNAGVAILVGGSYISHKVDDIRHDQTIMHLRVIPAVVDYAGEYELDVFTHLAHSVVTDAVHTRYKVVALFLDLWRMKQIYKKCFSTNCEFPSTRISESLNYTDFFVNHLFNIAYLGCSLVKDAIKFQAEIKVEQEMGKPEFATRVHSAVQAAFKAEVERRVAAARKAKADEA